VPQVPLPDDGRIRCGWPDSPRMSAYHDTEWGTPVHDDNRLFEMLVLGGAQAGLSWSTILNKRAGYRAAFAGFDPERVAAFGPEDVARLLADPGIVRNRQKIEAAIHNARRVREVRAEWGSLAAYLWSFTDGRPVVNAWRTLAELPARTGLSDRMSRDLKARGFQFAGSTICYAFMQTVGIVNDHTVDCFRHPASAGRSGAAGA
jgi:DNA-3-methyladenine glycosylase I